MRLARIRQDAKALRYVRFGPEEGFEVGVGRYCCGVAVCGGYADGVG